MNRRSFIVFLAGAGLVCGQNPSKVVVPHSSWNCGMPEGIPSPESGSLIFEVETKLERIADIGKTPYGNRRVAVGLEGVVSDSKLSGTVMPGALDFE